MKIAVAGTGYVGLVTGVCLSEQGHHVTCVDVDTNKIILMKSGKSPIYEPGLSELMTKNLDRLTFTTDYNDAYQDADVVIIAVGTPEKADGSANLSYVFGVAEEIASSITKECVVIVKSTVPIGTNDEVENILNNNTAGVKVYVASNPEFLAQGTAVQDTLHASRIVLGVNEKFAEERLVEMYKDFDAPIIVCKRRSAEMIKYASNDFLALKISYMNEVANLCEEIGANIEDVAKGMGFDERIGKRFLHAGIGYGGSCFPKDTKALHHLSAENGCEMRTVKATIDVNEVQKFKLSVKARKYYPDYSGLTIAVLGLTFKPGTDDLREAPSLVNIPVFLEDGATVKAWDPVGIDNFKKRIINDKLLYCDTIEETLAEADICFIFTEWQDVKDVSFETYEKLMKEPIIMDGRNCYSLKTIGNAKVLYESIGREIVDHR
ncbi:MAG TPA: UDP-glucose/GDP-mannose dehydrogenase family protein [Lachnospiraceae bacterium]|nr:UDP-glucose/GDP-mannose dehydrogenase family protein [Lachnospiraceae bacterium]